MILEVILIILKITASIWLIKRMISWVVDRIPKEGLFNNHKEKVNYKKANKILNKLAKKYSGIVVKPSVITSDYNKKTNHLNDSSSLQETLYVDFLLIIGNSILVVQVKNKNFTVYNKTSTIFAAKRTADWIKNSFSTVENVQFCVFDTYRGKDSICLKKFKELENLINNMKPEIHLSQMILSEMKPDYYWFNNNPLLASKGYLGRKELKIKGLGKKRLGYCK